MTIQIRPVVKGDIDSILLLLQQLWPKKKIHLHQIQSLIQQQLLSRNHHLVVAEQQNRVIGFGSLSRKINLWTEGMLGHIDELVVDDREQQRGIGTIILNYIIERGLQLGCRRIELDSAYHRKQAHQFYQRKGFVNRAILFSKQV
ncbi:MAG: GNAT family N-acetyltransferase [Candidatus Bathyarchaeia archaeon]